MCWSAQSMRAQGGRRVGAQALDITATRNSVFRVSEAMVVVDRCEIRCEVGLVVLLGAVGVF